MYAHHRLLVVEVERLLVAIFTACLLGAAVTFRSVDAGTEPVEAWAFCGVHPDDTNAATAVQTLAAAHIDATFGPCLAPDWTTYTAAEPGRRYATPDVYARLVALNATVGMRTVVYDARLWSDSAEVRWAAIVYWTPVLDRIAAWDMGDEFDPRSPDWQTLVDRCAAVRHWVTPFTGIEPFTNHLPDETVIDRALADFGTESVSFDCYDPERAVALAERYAPQVGTLTAAVNALEFGGPVPTPSAVADTERALIGAGVDRLLIFGGAYPYGETLGPDPTFGGHSLIDTSGQATPLAAAVLQGAMP